jgi:hypothetical protein
VARAWVAVWAAWADSNGVNQRVIKSIIFISSYNLSYPPSRFSFRELTFKLLTLPLIVVSYTHLMLIGRHSPLRFLCYVQ